MQDLAAVLLRGPAGPAALGVGRQRLQQMGAEIGLGQEGGDAVLAHLVGAEGPLKGGGQENGHIVPQHGPQLPACLYPIHAGHAPAQDGGEVVPAFRPGLGRQLQGRVRAAAGVADHAHVLEHLLQLVAAYLVAVRRQDPQAPQLLLTLLAAVQLLQGDGDGEAGALALPALHLDVAVHHPHQIVGDGHAETGALDAVDGGGPLKGLEDAPEEVLAHAHTGVLHRELVKGVAGTGGVPLVRLPDAQGDGPLLRGEFDGVGQDVDEHLLDAQMVAPDALAADAGEVLHHLLALFLRLGQEHRHEGVDEIGHGEILGAEGHLAGLDAAHVQNVVDEAQKMPGGQADLVQTVRHPLRLAQMGLGDGGHADDGVEGRADVVGHVGEKIRLGAGGGVGRIQSALQGGVGGAELLLLVLPVLRLVPDQRQDQTRLGAGEPGGQVTALALALPDPVTAGGGSGERVPHGLQKGMPVRQRPGRRVLIRPAPRAVLVLPRQQHRHGQLVVSDCQVPDVGLHRAFLFLSCGAGQNLTTFSGPISARVWAPHMVMVSRSSAMILSRYTFNPSAPAA